jgi:signal transduction histidine kinase/ligand-binding sensor domain-containing protein
MKQRGICEGIRAKWLVSVILFHVTLFVFCQEQNIYFQQITSENGLSQGHVLCMVQDREGYIWIGTLTGLNRYDGYNFTTYSHKENDSTSLVNNVIFSLYQDHLGFIWVGTAWGLEIFDPRTHRFEHFAAVWGNNATSDGEIRKIVQDKYQNIWVATGSGGLNKIIYATKRVIQYKAGSKQASNLQSDRVTDLLIDCKGRLWISTNGGGLSLMNIDTEKITTFRKDKKASSLPDDNISCIFEDRQKTLWLGSTHGKLIRYNEQFNQFELINYGSGNKEENRIAAINQDWLGNLMLGTDGAGLFFYNPRNNFYKQFQHVRNEPGSLIADEVSCILLDRNNTAFIGSFGRGISFFSSSSLKFEPHYISTSNTKGDVNSFTHAAEDAHGNIIVGSYNGFYVYDRKTWQYKHILPGKTYNENKILSIAIGPDNDIWLASNTALFRYSSSFQKIQSYMLKDDNMIHPIYSMKFDKQNNLWLGLFTEGLVRISASEWKNKKSKQLKYQLYQVNYNDSNSISGNQNWVINIDSKQNIWVGNEGGIGYFSDNPTKCKRVNVHANIKSICFDKEGNIWAGSSGKGIFSFQPSSGQINNYTKQNGLSHDFVFGMELDTLGNLWISTESGLSRLNLKTLSFRNFDTYNGLPDNHFEDHNSALLRDGSIYFGTSNGFVIFDPAKLVDDTVPVVVKITSLSFFKPVIGEKHDSLFRSLHKLSLDGLTEIRLTPKQRDFSIEFAALQFAVPHKTLYAYMLEGFDEGWIYADANHRRARYTNLDGGTYIFKVKATNSDGIWNEIPAELKIIVTPPFYRSNWFRVLSFFFVVFSVAIMFRLIVSRQIRLKKYLAEQVAQRTLEVSEKNILLEKKTNELLSINKILEERQVYIEEQKEEIAAQRDKLVDLNATKDKLFSIIAHDLKNPFNVILGYTDLLILHNDTYSAEKRLRFLTFLKQSSNSAYALLENLLQWSRGQSKNLSFNPVPVSAEKIITLGIEHVSNMSENKQIAVRYIKPEYEIVFCADENMLVTVVRNLLANAIKFSNRCSEVHVLASSDEKEVAITVKDFGTGMTPQTRDNLFSLERTIINTGVEGEKGSGLGLLICRDFVNLHKGKIEVQSEPGKGTQITFTIPIQQS